MSTEPSKYQINQPYNIKPVRPLLWAIVLFLILTCGVMGLIVYLLTDEELFVSYRLTSTLAWIEKFYPDEFNESGMLRSAREGVFGQLDRYSGYMERQELERVEEEFGGSYGGIGITVVGHADGLMIMSVREDSPAGKAGIKTGDVILEADSVSMKGKSPYDATYYLRGPDGSSVRILLGRSNMQDTLTYILIREQLKLIHVPYAGVTDKGHLYIRILDFETGAAEELAAVFDTLFQNKQDSIKGIIIDLRGNPGGLLNEALAISNLFLDEGALIVGVKGRSRWRQMAYYSSGEDITKGLPLAIVIDRGSASASEIVAGSLRYAGRAVLVGDTTFGKGLVQEFDGFSDGSGIRLTTARYYFEGGKYLNDPDAEIRDSAAGVPPDFYVSTGDQDDFILRLESSAILRDFAILNKDEIAPNNYTEMISSDWYERLASFAQTRDFRYDSPLTRELKNTLALITFESYSKETFESADRLYEVSKMADSARMNEYRDYIIRRLYQIALEANFGMAVSYPRAVLPYREDIRMAESLLSSQPIP